MNVLNVDWYQLIEYALKIGGAFLLTLPIALIQQRWFFWHTSCIRG